MNLCFIWPKLVPTILVFLFSSLSSQAHIVGMDPFCIANSPVHFECFYLIPADCEKTATQKTTAFESWQCVPYPVDFRKKSDSNQSKDIPPPINSTEKK